MDRFWVLYLVLLSAMGKIQRRSDTIRCDVEYLRAGRVIVMGVCAGPALTAGSLSRMSKLPLDGYHIVQF